MEGPEQSAWAAGSVTNAGLAAAIKWLSLLVLLFQDTGAPHAMTHCSARLGPPQPSRTTLKPFAGEPELHSVPRPSPSSTAKGSLPVQSCHGRDAAGR